MPFTPLAFCSIGADTVSATSLQPAPVKYDVILTCGGTTFGNSATGSFRKAMAPASVIRIASTVEKMGRSMKKLTIIYRVQFRFERSYFADEDVSSVLAGLSESGRSNVCTVGFTLVP